MKWLPIETAPKDGTHILCYDPSRSHRIDIYNYKNNHWEEVDRNGFSMRKPTHWIPIPPPPSDTKQCQCKCETKMRQIDYSKFQPNDI